MKIELFLKSKIKKKGKRSLFLIKSENKHTFV